MAFGLRPFLEQDSQAILAIANAAIPYDLEGNQRWLRLRIQVDEQRFLRRHYVVIGEEARQLVGYGALEQQGPDPQRLRVYLLAHPGFLRRGVGNALYARLMEDLEKLNVTGLWMQEYHQDSELLGFMHERGFVQTRLTWDMRLSLAKANVSRLMPILEEVAARGIIISTLTEEYRRNPGVLPLLHALFNAARDESFRPLTFEAFRQELDQPGVIPQGFFIAREGERLIGLSALWRMGAEPDYAIQRWTGVLPIYRRQGIGAALRLCTIDTAQRLGFHMLVAYTDHSDPVMLALNEKLDFHRWFGYATLEKSLQ